MIQADLTKEVFFNRGRQGLNSGTRKLVFLISVKANGARVEPILDVLGKGGGKAPAAGRLTSPNLVTGSGSCRKEEVEGVRTGGVS